MNNLGLFFQFGIRMQGGPAFLKRTRTAFGQLQTRTRTVTGTFTCNCGWSCNVQCGGGPCTTFCSGGNSSYGSSTCGPGNQNEIRLVCGQNWWEVCGYADCGSGQWYCSYQICNCSTCTSYSDWSAWSNTSSCTPSATRQCQTVYSFREEDWSAYEEVDVCVVASPTAALNAVQVECVPQ
jgi:hypothetical protein